MKRYLAILFLFICHVLVQGQELHPHILVKASDKKAVLEKISQQAWAATAFQKMTSHLQPYVERHRTDPSWMLSRYLMNRGAGKHYTTFYSDADGTALTRYSGHAAYPTIRVSSHKRPPITKDGYTYKLPSIEEQVPYDSSMKMLLQSNAPGGKKEWVNPQTFVEVMNGRINDMVLDAAVAYWLTGKKEYAVFAADILNQWARGASQQEPVVGPCRTGFLSIQTLGDGRYEPLILAYDFLYDFLRTEKYETSYYEKVFEKIAHTMTFRGYWNNNWFAAQAPAMVFAALSLEDKSRRNYYLNFFLKKDTINGSCGHLALPSVVSKWLTPDGHWKEPGGYHNYPVGSLLVSAVAMENNGYQIFNSFPALFQASYVMLKYAFPNYNASSFGDTGTPSQSPENLEIGIAMARKYNHSVLPQLISAMEVLMSKKGYKRENSGYMGLLCFPAEIPSSAGVTFSWPRSGELDFAKCYIQRNGMDRKTGLMYAVQGATYNHNHANGMSVELYGVGNIMGLDPGKGVTYEAPMHVNYYAQWAAHNTVVAAARSASVPYFTGGGGTKRIGEISLQAMEPLAGKEAVSAFCSFTDTRYTDISTNTLQQRTLAIIRTTDTTGYYLDIYRSANKKSNEYMYHNFGNELTLTTAVGKRIPLSRKKFPLNKKPFDPPGLRFIKELHSSGLRKEVTNALFTVKEKEQTSYMQVLMPPATDREYFSGKGPKSPTAPSPFNEMPTPTLIVRQKGEAWKQPFIAVYEPYSGTSGRSVQKIQQLFTKDTGNYTLLQVENRDSSRQMILQSVDKDNALKGNEWQFKGYFGVIGLSKTGLDYLYLGEGSELMYGNYGLKMIDGKGAANLKIDKDLLVLDCTEETLVTLNDMHPKKIVITTATRQRDVVFTINENGVTFFVQPVKNAMISIIR